MSTQKSAFVKAGEMPGGERRGKKSIKCVVWDLDNTLWDGVLLEDQSVALRQIAVEAIKTLDGRGILQSVASKNDYPAAMEKLEEAGLSDYFLYPQINWNSKALSISLIAQSLNIGLDAIAFIDDQAFEREEVRYSLPEVLCIDAAETISLVNMPEMNPAFVTEDSRLRRLMYISDQQRKTDEQEFVGPKEEFLASLNMRFTISAAAEGDLMRAEELVVRTNQLNTTGITYSYEELDLFRRSPEHRLLMAEMEDRYGSYGKIGLACVECGPEVWTLKLLLMSCRVMSHGVGTILLIQIMRLAKEAGVALRAEMVHTGRNRMMQITLKFAGFREVGRHEDLIILENDLNNIQPIPDYVKVRMIH